LWWWCFVYWLWYLATWLIVFCLWNVCRLCQKDMCLWWETIVTKVLILITGKFSVPFLLIFSFCLYWRMDNILV
jgi:hypothetical protein